MRPVYVRDACKCCLSCIVHREYLWRCATHRTAIRSIARIQIWCEVASTLAALIVLEWSGFVLRAGAMIARSFSLLRARAHRSHTHTHVVRIYSRRSSSTFVHFLLSSYCFLCSHWRWANSIFLFVRSFVRSLVQSSVSIAWRFRGRCLCHFFPRCLRVLKWNGIVRFCDGTQHNTDRFDCVDK